MQRAGQAARDAVDRTRQKLHDRVVEAVRGKFDAVDPGLAQRLEQFEFDVGKSKAFADFRIRLLLQRRGDDIGNADTSA